MIEQELREAIAGVLPLLPSLDLKDDQRLEHALTDLTDLLSTPGDREASTAHGIVSADPTH